MHGVVRVGAQPVQLAPPVLEALTDDVADDDVADDDIADDANDDLMSENDSAVHLRPNRRQTGDARSMKQSDQISPN